MEMKDFLTSPASLLGVLASCLSLLHMVFPPALRSAFLRFLVQALRCCSSYCYFDIAEIDGVNTNELYNAVQLYLGSFVSASSSRLSLTRSINSNANTFGLSNDDFINDVFDGVVVQWEHVVMQNQSRTSSQRSQPDEKRCFMLRIRKCEKDLILAAYLNQIIDKANDICRKNQERLLYTNSCGGSLDSCACPWESVSFNRPSTSDTLAMEPERKRDTMEDLHDFAVGQTFYQRSERAWKWGYLLYSSPGTGKSSMITAMADFLGYDVYDLELTEVDSNSDLWKLLMKTSSKSIIVVKDIGCLVDLSNKSNAPHSAAPISYYDPEEPDAVCSGDDENNNTITLSGLVNFTDRLWSCCGSERIFVFTINHIEKLNLALLRSGRMDMRFDMESVLE